MRPDTQGPRVQVYSLGLGVKMLTVSACLGNLLRSYRLVIRIEKDQATDPLGQDQVKVKECEGETRR